VAEACASRFQRDPALRRRQLQSQMKKADASGARSGHLGDEEAPAVKRASRLSRGARAVPRAAGTPCGCDSDLLSAQVKKNEHVRSRRQEQLAALKAWWKDQAARSFSYRVARGCRGMIGWTRYERSQAAQAAVPVRHARRRRARQRSARRTRETAERFWRLSVALTRRSQPWFLPNSSFKREI